MALAISRGKLEVVRMIDEDNIMDLLIQNPNLDGGYNVSIASLENITKGTITKWRLERGVFMPIYKNEGKEIIVSYVGKGHEINEGRYTFEAPRSILIDRLELYHEKLIGRSYNKYRK